MKIACLGDLHGADRWKDALDLGADHYVFVGDYVDSYVFDDQTILDNLKDVIQFKIDHPDAVTLLWGNHDIQYLYYPRFRGSGFRPAMAGELRSIFHEHHSLFQIAYSHRSFVFTHAGLHRRWVDQAVGTFGVPSELVLKLNRLMDDEKSLERLTSVGTARGGTSGYGGPLWCDFDLELTADPCPGIDQVVGHTQRKFLGRVSSSGNTLLNVNYLAYSLEPIFVLELK